MDEFPTLDELLEGERQIAAGFGLDVTKRIPSREHIDHLSVLWPRFKLLRAVAEAGIQSNESLRDAIGCIHAASIKPWSKRVADFDAALAAWREAEGK